MKFESRGNTVYIVFFQGIMAVLFWVKSPAFIEDLSIPEEAHHDASHFIEALDKSYQTVRCEILPWLGAVYLFSHL